ncbi:MAG: hypothetical protein M3O46_12790 [Myxococcota bacterium]|nr:hypothetical protein [Myxococcota bacterium]
MRRCIIVFLLTYASAGCSSLLGDFTTAPETSDAGTAVDGGAGDAITAGDGDGDNGSATVVHVITADVSVYLGETAAIDASKSTTTRGSLTFAWTVSSVPAGSRISTASLIGVDSATVRFAPDRAGDYVVAVTALGLGASDARSATVTAAVPQVLFAQGVTGAQRGAGGGQAAAYYTIADLDGGNAHPVLCPDVVSNAPNRLVPALYAAYAGRAYDYWEAPPGQPSRFAAFTVDYAPDGLSIATHLWAGTTQSTCTAPPVDLGATIFGPGRPYGSEPHFNPDGTSFVVFDQQWHIVTYAADGGRPPNVITTYGVPYDQASQFLDPLGLEASNGYSVEPPRVAWTANGLELAWAQPTVGGWQIVTAADKPNQTPTTYMTCTGVTPREIALLPDGTVIASFRQTRGSSENLYQLKPDAQQKCSQEHQYTNLADSGSSTATDFAVSPDRSQIAFLQIDTSLQDAGAWQQGNSQLPGGYVYVVPVAGGIPKLLSSEPALFGPRWIGAGTALVFTRLDGMASSTGKPATSVVVIAPDGGAEHTVAQGDGVSTFVSTSGNAACNVGGGALGRLGRTESAPAFSSLLTVLGWLGLGARAVRRRAVRGQSSDRP